MFDDASKKMLAALEDLATQIWNMTARITKGLTKNLQQHYGEPALATNQNL
jgi:16S rRNA C1402 (ribose-2'-O) methylase RsmI